MPFRARWIALGAAAVIVAFAVLLAINVQDQGGAASPVPRLAQEHAAAPAVNLKTLDGKTIDAKTLAGKTYVINFFNSWCIPCQQEAGDLEAFYDQHKNEKDFEMVGIVRDDEESAVRNYVNEKRVAYPVAITGASQATLDYGTTGQPETYVVAPDGVIVCGALGPSTQAALNTWLQAARAGQQCE
jgi:cytochrome c biogenesis protein CcmG/thiol:disulfide interchange protein DsbE